MYFRCVRLRRPGTSGRQKRGKQKTGIVGRGAADRCPEASGAGHVSSTRHRRRTRKGARRQKIRTETIEMRHRRRAVRSDRQEDKRSVEKKKNFHPSVRVTTHGKTILKTVR